MTAGNPRGTTGTRSSVAAPQVTAKEYPWCTPFGRKRHALVDTTGLLLGIKVLPASINDRKGGQALLESLRKNFPRLGHIWADQGYTGELKRWAEACLGLTFEVVYPWWRQIERYLSSVYEQQPVGFKVIPRRWVVERTFAWWTFQRRLNRDYDRR